MVIHSYDGNVSESDRALPLYAVTVGESRPQGTIHRPAGIKDYQLLYTKSGVGRVRIKEEEFEVRSGDVFILPPFTPHEYSPIEEGWNTAWITYNGGAAKNSFPFSADIRQVVDFKAFYKKIHKGNTLPEWRRKTSAALYELLLLIWEQKGLSPSGEVAREPDISTAVQYISEHFQDTVELSALAAMSGLSEGHFCRVFKSHTHMRPIEYITHLKIEKAKDLLLQSPPLPISEIGKLVGYSSAAYFSKTFKQKTSATPEEYRKSRDSKTGGSQ